MQHVVGLRGHVSHPERQMEASEHQQGPRDQPQLDQLWVGAMALHLRHTRRVQGCGYLCQPGRERQGRVLLGGARRRAGELRAEGRIECLRLLRRLADVLSPVARVQRGDCETHKLLQRTGEDPALFERAIALEERLEGLRAVTRDATHLVARGQEHRAQVGILDGVWGEDLKMGHNRVVP
jgi:hypothetical protein